MKWNETKFRMKLIRIRWKNPKEHECLIVLRLFACGEAGRRRSVRCQLFQDEIRRTGEANKDPEQNSWNWYRRNCYPVDGLRRAGPGTRRDTWEKEKKCCTNENPKAKRVRRHVSVWLEKLPYVPVHEGTLIESALSGKRVVRARSPRSLIQHWMKNRRRIEIAETRRQILSATIKEFFPKFQRSAYPSVPTCKLISLDSRL